LLSTRGANAGASSGRAGSTAALSDLRAFFFLLPSFSPDDGLRVALILQASRTHRASSASVSAACVSSRSSCGYSGECTLNGL